MAHQATQSFVMAWEDGAGEDFIRKGTVVPDNHPWVKRDTTGTLFKRLFLDGESEPAKPAPKKAAPAAPAKAAPGKAAS